MLDNRLPAIRKCTCGSIARVRYKIPVVWIECGKKCGMRTGYHTDKRVPHDPDSQADAIHEWNRMVQDNG